MPLRNAPKKASFGGWGNTHRRATSLTHLCLHRLRSGYSTKDYSLTGLVWSAVNLSPEQLGHGVSLKVTVVCDSLREALTFTCDCECPSPCTHLSGPLAAIGGHLG